MKAKKSTWLEDGQSCLSVALRRLEELSEQCTDAKQLQAIVDTVFEVVSTGEALAAKGGRDAD